jgi:hypothetical protein
MSVGSVRRLAARILDMNVPLQCILLYHKGLRIVHEDDYLMQSLFIDLPSSDPDAQKHDRRIHACVAYHYLKRDGGVEILPHECEYELATAVVFFVRLPDETLCPLQVDHGVLLQRVEVYVNEVFTPTQPIVLVDAEDNVLDWGKRVEAALSLMQIIRAAPDE